MAGRKKKDKSPVNFEPLPGVGRVTEDGQSILFSNGAVFKRIVLPSAFAKQPDSTGVDLSELEEDE